MFFIVSISKDTLKLDHHMNRLGYHFRHSIVEEARKILNQRGHHEQAAYVHEPGKPEPIPSSQREIDLEADAVLRDLFPRIPHTDRQQIIDHAFKKDGKFNGEIKVGMAKDITLARRVQLAALAHIRHTHTRYDDLLKESDWANARKAVEKPCLDIIVKWRGDEETGRDQLDEILREVIEISDTETDSEDEKSSPDNTRIQVPRTMRTAVIPSRAVSRLSRPLNDPSGVSRQTSSPVLASPRTPSGVRKLAKADRRTARKTQQRFKRYAAAAEALANSSGQNVHPESPSTPGFVATPVEVVRRQGSAHPVNTYHTVPGATVQEAYVTRISNGHADSQRIPISQSSGLSQDRTVMMPHIASDARVHGGTEQFIRVPDDQRPKVGPYSANYSQAPAPSLSPIRMSLKDMLLPSIEPRSPDVVRASLDATHRVPNEAQRPTEVPRRVISRTIVEPAMPHPRPRSPGVMANEHEDAAKRRRVITYFPEDYQKSSDSFYVRVAPRSQHDASRYSRLEYPADRRPAAPGATERVLYKDIPRGPLAQDVRVFQSEDGHGRLRGHPTPVTRDELPLIGATAPGGIYQNNMRMPVGPEYEAPLRSRANPVVIDGDGRYEPRRVVEVRGSPAHDIYRTTSPRGSAVHSPGVQGDPRTKGSPRVVYLDNSTSRIGSNSGSRHHIASQNQPGLRAYEGPRPLSPGVSLHPVHQPRAEQPLRYAVPFDREGARPIEPERNASAWPGTASVRIQASSQETPRIDRFTGLQQHPSVLPQQPRSDVVYQGLRPDATRPAAVGYERAAQQPFPVHPAPSSYVEIRGPSPHRRIPDHRDMIYVE
ncbi:hypothetical protein F5B22DRAFT_635322 [Xylaria bambusicola]|uniref:uncharacterized protein n=1 Tax=Xylaria bambusicola TaxID=326684 RepID=UPI002007788D|nr:uncharacterized protein F5B22DRAFT_635322 [Xylaria bambusicola]KAI0518222.1 hypothetical protein F5B22DRAFT_635322 [Xylaria bambusicola]